MIMGVSGCGKTSVGEALSARLGHAFVDGDTLHPPANIAKMSAGKPLDDADRAPWLAAVGRVLAEASGPILIGCSALKRAYRDIIRENAGEDVAFLHLAAPIEVLRGRVTDRPGHFMPASLLESQYATLEALATDETGIVIDISGPLADVIDECAAYLKENA